MTQTRKRLQHHLSILAAVVLALTLWLPCYSYAASLTANITNQQVGLGEAFQLTLSSDEISGGNPDLSPLQQDFTILGTSQSSQIKLINGTRSQSRSWVITLVAKDLGTQLIPALSLGGMSTKPLSIDVVKSKPSLPSSQQGDIKLTATIKPKTYYQFQEIPITVRLETTVPFESAELISPNSPAFEIEHVGNDRSGQLIRDNQTVSVIERDYILRPQKTGDIVIPPFIIQGYLQGNRVDPFAGFHSNFDAHFERFFNDPFSSMTTRGKAFSVSTKENTLAIQENPSTTADEWFLPATAVQLSATWQPTQPSFTVGEAVTRVIRIEALGARPEQLPTLEFVDTPGIKWYVDNDTTGMNTTAEGTQALREITVSIVPTQSGKLSIPEQSITWFNTKTNTKETALLPAEIITVTGSTVTQGLPAKKQVSAQPTAGSITNSTPKTPETNTVHSTIIAAVQQHAVALVSIAVVVLVTVVTLWIWSKRRRQTAPVDNSVNNTKNCGKVHNPDYQKNIQEAINTRNERQVYQELLRWQRSGETFSESLTQHLHILEQHGYGIATKTVINWQALSAAVVQQQRKNDNTSVTKPPLPPLYADKIPRHK